MDGNGRWAQRRRRQRIVGHRIGARSVRRVVEAAPRLGIDTLTLFAFSSDNWARPPAEVAGLFRLFRRYLLSETERCREAGVRLRIIGRRSRLPVDLLETIQDAEERTADGKRLRLRIAIDYSSRAAIVAATQKFTVVPDEAEFRQALSRAIHDDLPLVDLDLLIRTGGERRLSDFLLFEAAYAELYFSDTAWPDFGVAHLEEALRAYARRDRRFGRIDTGLEEVRSAS